MNISSRIGICSVQEPFACYKSILDRTSYFNQRYVKTPPEGLDQGQRQQIMLWRQKIEYLGYHITRDGVMLIPNKVEAIQALAVPKISQTIVSVYRYDKVLL